ncbi:hypothetical protein ACFWB0_06770 [Rhodococcus sp. NPDC060086]|uniref:hypothetical protein n=1 Tax=Rhodococcus sp. NPDC060086 TaxID=3347055 RepID=UPI003660CAE5
MSTERTLVAHTRGCFVGGTSGAVSIAAHAAGGGATPGQGSVALLLAAAVAVGATAAGTRLSAIAVLTVGQILGHIALVLESGHIHVPSLAMVAAHIAAVGVAAVLIIGAERGCSIALAALHRLVPRGYTAPPVRSRVTPWVEHRPRTRRVLLPAAGLGTRGPPALAA